MGGKAMSGGKNSVIKKKAAIKEWDERIEIECDGWRSWERLGKEILDWDGITCLSGHVTQDEFNEKPSRNNNTYFRVTIYTLRSHSKQVFEKLKSYPGVTKGKLGDCVDVFGEYWG